MRILLGRRALRVREGELLFTVMSHSLGDRQWKVLRPLAFFHSHTGYLRTTRQNEGNQTSVILPISKSALRKGRQLFQSAQVKGFPGMWTFQC